MVDELPDAFRLVLHALLEAPVLWRTPAEIAAAIGRGGEETSDLLCDLDLAGWLAVWDAEAGPVVTLSPLAAARLGVRVVEVGARGTHRWARAGEPDPPAPRPKHVCLSERAATLEFVPDPSPSPEAAAARSERAAARARAVQSGPPSQAPPRADDLPRPSVLVGLSLSPWPGPASPTALACPACAGRVLPPQMYCLYCDRWGLDGLAPGDGGGQGRDPRAPEPPRGPRPRRPAPDRPDLDRLQAERLRARRNAKRDGRRAAQARADAERRRKEPARAVPVPDPPRHPTPAVDFTRPPR